MVGQDLAQHRQLRRNEVGVEHQPGLAALRQVEHPDQGSQRFFAFAEEFFVALPGRRRGYLIVAGEREEKAGVIESLAGIIDDRLRPNDVGVILAFRAEIVFTAMAGDERLEHRLHAFPRLFGGDAYPLHYSRLGGIEIDLGDPAGQFYPAVDDLDHGSDGLEQVGQRHLIDILEEVFRQAEVLKENPRRKIQAVGGKQAFRGKIDDRFVEDPRIESYTLRRGDNCRTPGTGRTAGRKKFHDVSLV